MTKFRLYPKIVVAAICVAYCLTLLKPSAKESVVYTIAFIAAWLLSELYKYLISTSSDPYRGINSEYKIVCILEEGRKIGDDVPTGSLYPLAREIVKKHNSDYDYEQSRVSL